MPMTTEVANQSSISRLKLKKHVGVVLEPSIGGFDEAASAFGCVINDPHNGSFYLYYTGSSDTRWTKASIGVAHSSDGIDFTKCPDNPVVSVGKQSVTPAVFKTCGKYWMAFAYATGPTACRRVGIAVSQTPYGPWMFTKDLAKADIPWEGSSIDIGPSVAHPSDEEHFIFYSNVNLFGGKLPNIFWGPRRQIGILRVKITESSDVQAEKWVKNPLAHLNGARGSWRESLFCPGYVDLGGDRHCLFPASSTCPTRKNGSLGLHPMRPVSHEHRMPPQDIGLIEDSTLLFQEPAAVRILINGSEEKHHILPNMRGQIALDSPCPLIIQNELWLYYSVMDRSDGIWKTALSIFSMQ